MTSRSRRWLFLLLLLPLAWGALRLRLDIEVLNLLPSESPAVQGLKLFQENFSNARELVISIQTAAPETAESTAQSLAQGLRQLTNLISNVAWQPPWMEHPSDAAELIGYLWLNSSPQTVSTLAERLSPDTLRLTLQRLTTSFSPADLARLSHDPFDLMQLPSSMTGGDVALGQDEELFSSADGTFRILFVQAKDELLSYRDCAAWISQIQNHVQQILSTQGEGSARIRYTGRPAFVTEIASGMERDITRSMTGTLGIIALLFWAVHRNWRPLLWLLVLLLTTLLATLALGGLFLGTLNVISIGFAAILLGLSVDFALILYQEHRAAPHESAAAIRRLLAPGILWSSVTTAGAFLILNWGGLPGLGQLGTLVALGISVAAAIMLYWFLPPLIRHSRNRPLSEASPSGKDGFWRRQSKVWRRSSIVWCMTGATLAWACFALREGLPPLDHTANSLRPRNSQAHAALEEIKVRMERTQEPLWLLISGRNETEVGERLAKVGTVLSTALNQGAVSNYTLPSALWPHPGHQQANRPALSAILAQKEPLLAAARDKGFTEASLEITRRIFQTWEQALLSENTFWPSNNVSDWILQKLTARKNGEFFALGFIHPPEPSDNQPTAPAAWAKELPEQGVWLAGWELLGEAVLEVVQRNLAEILGAMALLVLSCLWLAFRNWKELALSLAALGFSLFLLLGLMAAQGLSWNLLNLMALPLLIGSGIDYSIHIQLALRRHRGDVAQTRRIVGRALCLCAATTATAFGSLAWSSNSGLASLGQVCALGIAATAFTAIFLLPEWWRQGKCLRPQSPPPPDSNRPSPAAPAAARKNAAPETPSSIYRPEIWRLGQALLRILPPAASEFLGRKLGWAYWRLHRARRETVIQNLLPLTSSGSNREEAELLAKQLFLNFAAKILDLFRYESGLPIDHLFLPPKGWEHIERARQQQRGVLLLTPHLGNWEFGAPLLAKQGIPLLVITLAEPRPALTAMRKASRERWGIETLVIGENPFAFVEVIRRLEAGATVALLVDRPPPNSAVSVTLFERPFAASIAAAELARATGCVLLPVLMPKTGGHYAAHVLPEIAYQQKDLRTREARRLLTQQIMTEFEPFIKASSAQWYHFVPIWRHPPLPDPNANIPAPRNPQP